MLLVMAVLLQKANDYAHRTNRTDRTSPYMSGLSVNGYGKPDTGQDRTPPYRGVRMSGCPKSNPDMFDFVLHALLP